MAVNATLNFGGTIAETAEVGHAGQNSVIQWATNITRQISLTSATTPPVHYAWYTQGTLSGTTATISLVALARTGMAALNLDTKIIYFWCFQNLGANVMTITPGTQGYLLVGTAGSLAVGPGGSAQNYSPVGFGTVATGATQNVLITGTSTQSYRFAVVAGTP